MLCSFFYIVLDMFDLLYKTKNRRYNQLISNLIQINKNKIKIDGDQTSCQAKSLNCNDAVAHISCF